MLLVMLNMLNTLSTNIMKMWLMLLVTRLSILTWLRATTQPKLPTNFTRSMVKLATTTLTTQSSPLMTVTLFTLNPLTTPSLRRMIPNLSTRSIKHTTSLITITLGFISLTWTMSRLLSSTRTPSTLPLNIIKATHTRPSMVILLIMILHHAMLTMMNTALTASMVNIAAILAMVTTAAVMSTQDSVIMVSMLHMVLILSTAASATTLPLVVMLSIAATLTMQNMELWVSMVSMVLTVPMVNMMLTLNMANMVNMALKVLPMVTVKCLLSMPSIPLSIRKILMVTHFLILSIMMSKVTLCITQPTMASASTTKSMPYIMTKTPTSQLTTRRIIASTTPTMTSAM